MYHPNEVVRNLPIPVWWAGWRTDTLKLGADGWQISAEQDPMRGYIRIAINHPELQIQGITEMHEYTFRRILQDPRGVDVPVQLRFKTMGQRVFVETFSGHNTFDFNPVDWRPTIMNTRGHALSDICHFQKLEIEEPKHELYLHEANINQILEMALSIQEPEQERIRKEMIKRRDLANLRMGTLHTELRLVA